MPRKITGGGLSAFGFFNEGYFRALTVEVFAVGKSKVGNPGQLAILNEISTDQFQDELVRVSTLGKRPTKTVYENVFYLALGNEKFEAIDLIITEMAELLYWAWDDATGGDGMGLKMYLEGSVAMMAGGVSNGGIPTFTEFRRALTSLQMRRGL